MTDYVLILLSLVLSAFYSGAETVLVSVNRLKFEALERLGVKGSFRVISLIEEPDRFLITCVVGTNIANVAWSSLVAIKLEPYLAGPLIAVVSTAVLLVFGEVLPKTIGRSVADLVAIPVSRIVTFFEYVFYPVTALLRLVGTALVRLLGDHTRTIESVISRRDLEYLFAAGSTSKALERQERAFITRLFRLGHQRVRDVMVPRTEIVGVRLDQPCYALRKKFEDTGLSRLLVYGENLDDVKGFVHVLDLFREPKRWQDMIRPVLAVPENITTVELLRRMRDERVSMAVIVDEYGGTEGIVTMEDLVEQLFGEIHDEFDYDERWVRRLGDRSFIVKGRAEIGYLNETFGLGLPRGDYATLSGLLNELAGRIPRVGETFTVGKWRVRILSTSRKRIEWVRLDPLETQEEDGPKQEAHESDGD